METGKHYYAYILHCADDTLYTGYTDNLEKRIRVHNTGDGAKYTRSRRPVALAYAVRCPSRGLAQSLEAKIKQLSRKEKLLLIANWGGNPNETPTPFPE